MIGLRMALQLTEFFAPESSPFTPRRLFFLPIFFSYLYPIKPSLSLHPDPPPCYRQAAMTARELRTRRRAEERKTRKSQQKQLEPLNASPTPALTHQDLDVSPETLAEFGPEFIARANAIRDRVHGQLAQPFAVSSPTPFRPGQSTGPRTSAGKAISSRNSFKHGLASGEVVISGEDPAAFDALLADLTADHAPANATEELLVHEMAQSYWLMNRATRLQNSCLTGDEVDCKQLALFLRYRTTYERAFDKALGTLIRLKKQRESASRQFVSHKAPRATSSAEFVRQNDPPIATKMTLKTGGAGVFACHDAILGGIS
jgi:hypothetical protein